MTSVARGAAELVEASPRPASPPPPCRRRARAAPAVLIVAALVTVLALALVAAVSVLSVVVSSGRPAGRHAPVVPTSAASTSPSPAPAREQALAVLLRERSRAVLAGDAGAWMSTVDPGVPGFAVRQSLVFDRLSEVPFATWRYDYSGTGPTLSRERLAELGTDDAWVARVVLEYQLQGAGPAVVRREQHLTLVDRAGRWLLAGDSDGRTAVDLWDLGPVHVVRTSRGLLVGTADTARLTELGPVVDAAAAHVDTIWGRAWPRTVVVMVPRDQAEMAALLGRDTTAGLDQIAAVTTGEVGSDSAGTFADRVIINPQGFDGLGPLGRDVVLRHEITHVAVRAASTRTVPIWLSEGFADYVAYEGTDLDSRDVAADVLQLVRQGRGPSRLPSDADFDATAGDIAPAYAGAWLAAKLVADRYGQPALVRFYLVASGGRAGTAVPSGTSPASPQAGPGSLDAAFRQVLGTDEPALTQEWRAELVRLASSSGA